MSPRYAAMNLLARREHSRLELENKLRRRYEKPEIAQTLDQLAADGLQCDERFALSFARDRMLRAYGPQKISAELRLRGVERRVIDRALHIVPADAGLDWRDVAASALQKRFGDSAVDTVEEKAKRIRYLNNRGFGELAIEVFTDLA